MLPSNKVVKTMSSREIAELTGSSHDNMLKTIRGLMKGGVVSGNETPYIHEQNQQTYYEIHLNYRDTMVVASGYSVELRAKIIDRWQELEAAQAVKVPTTLAGALRLAAEQAEEIERQQATIEQQRPAVEFVGRYVNAEGNKGLREVCKLLNTNERQFKKFLIDSKIMYILGGYLTPMAQHLSSGRFQVKTGVGLTGHVYNQTKFTPKGVEWIAGEWGKHNARSAQ